MHDLGGFFEALSRLSSLCGFVSAVIPFDMEYRALRLSLVLGRRLKAQEM